MQTFLITWRLLLLLSMLGMPQLLGILAYFRIRKHHNVLAHVIGILIPPILFFFLSQVILNSSVREIQTKGERVCGTYLGMMAIMILFGTGVQMFFSLIAQLMLHGRHRTTTVSEEV